MAAVYVRAEARLPHACSLMPRCVPVLRQLPAGANIPVRAQGLLLPDHPILRRRAAAAVRA